MEPHKQSPAVDPTRLLRALVLLAVGWFVLCFVFIALNRIGYPFDLEWMEGSAIAHLQRILAGQPLYHEPSMDHLPNMYTPLYYYVSALVSAVTGEGLVALRLVSLLSTLGILALLVLIVRRETGDWFAGAVSAGLFAATYRVTGAWLDLGRVDPLFLLLMLASVYWIRFGRGAPALLAAGALAGLAFMTKQTAALVGLPVGLYLLIFHWRKGLQYSAGVGAVVGGATLALHLSTEGWFLYYITLAGDHVWRHEFFVQYWTRDLLGQLPFATLLAALALSLRGAVAAPGRWIYLAVGVGFLAGSWYTRILPLGYDNVLLPGHLWICLMAGVGLHHLLERLRGGPRRWTWIALAACAAQLLMLHYDVGAQLPSGKDAAAGEQFVKRLRAIKGPVLVPYHDHLVLRAGKPGHAHLMPMWETFASKPSAGRRALVQSLDRALRQHRYSAVILNHNALGSGLRDAVIRYYEPRTVLFSPKQKIFVTVTGMTTRPAVLYVPRKR